MNEEDKKEYEEHYSPDWDYLQYQIENPEQFEQPEEQAQEPN